MGNRSHDLNAIFQALSDPTRRAVLQHLTGGPASVSELAEPFEMALPSFMKHIGVLEEAGLIRSRKTGRVRTCEVEPDCLTVAENWINDQRILWEGRMERMARYVEAQAVEREVDEDRGA